MRVACILPAAGSGQRMGSSIPKPFLPLAGKPVILHTIASLRAAVDLSDIILVLPAGMHEAIIAEYGERLTAAGVTACVPGGTSRQESVLFGLQAIQHEHDLIMVHDAVRPFPPASMIRKLCSAALEYGAALPVLPVTDTVKRVHEEIIGETVPRDGLYAVQTPQVFRQELLRAAYCSNASIDASLTDDAMLVEAIGGRVHAVDGNRYNLKLTTPEDMDMAEAFLSAGLIGQDS